MGKKNTEGEIIAILKKCDYIESQLKKQQTFFKENTNIFELKSRIVICDKLHCQYKENHDRLLELTDYSTEYIDDHDSQIQNDMCEESRRIVPATKQMSVKLPDIKLQSFDGSFDKWVTFRDTFKGLIHEHQCLSDIQRLHYLLGTLEGGAKKIIEKIEISSDGYKQAWDALNDRYNNNRIIVDKHIAEILKLKAMKFESASEIRRVVDETNNHIRGLKGLNQPVEHWDMIIINIVSSRIDTETRKLWEMHIPIDQFPTWDDMVAFLNTRARTLDVVSNNTIQSTSYQPYKNKFNTSINSKQVSTSPKTFHVQQTLNMNCNICKSNSHYPTQCTNFLSLSVADRLAKVKQLQLCTNCLRHNHRTNECHASVCKNCQKKHHTLLHNSAINNTNKKTLNSDSQFKTQVAQYSNSLTNTHTLLSTTVIFIEDVSGNLHKCRVLLDSASQSNFIVESFANRLNLTKQHSVVSVTGLNASSVTIKNKVSTSIRSCVNNYRTQIEFLLIPKITNFIPAKYISKSNWHIPENVNLVDPLFNEPAKIDALIGAELFFEIIKDGQIKINNNTPVLQNTEFGYILSGKFTESQHNTNMNFLLISNEELNEQLKLFWQIESYDCQTILSEEEKKCEQHFIQTHKREKSGRYSVQLPLKDNITNLGESKNIALRRFKNLECKLNKDQELKIQYNKFINEYISFNHMSLANEDTYSENFDKTYYLPHHAVFKPSSTTTKVRVVFDASAKTTSGLSLNDVQMLGAIGQDDLFSIILRFRTHIIAFTADIEKMYRQINVDKSQRKLQRIFWRENTNEPIKIYELNTITYGTSSAPFLSTRTLTQLSIDEGNELPLAKKAAQNFYMDDIMTGADTVSDIIKIKNELVEMMSRGRMNLRKFSSNSEEFLNTIDESDRELKTLTDQNCEIVKTLGLTWNPSKDVFIFKTHKFVSNTNITKRFVLSEISKFYDPLGFLSPIIIRVKIFIQRLWLVQRGWDEELSENEKQFWIEFRNDVESTKMIELNRCILIENVSQIQYHGFADASESAYGACVYIKCKYNNKIITHLICSKSRIAPVKRLTIPRLELCAAHLLSKLITKIIKAMQLQTESIYLWSDSTIVLAWIKTPPNLLKTFVANRVSEIQELTNAMNWRHVESKQNPADYISRGVRPQELNKLEIWWHGPVFIHEQDEWPKNGVKLEEIYVHERKEVTLILQNEEFQLISKYSSYLKLLRVTAYCRRFIENVKISASERITDLIITPEELKRAQLTLIKLVQKEAFYIEIENLRKNKEIDKSSRIKNLSPFIDESGVIRVGGRIKNCHLSFEEKHPIILPNKHQFTVLLFRYEHINQFHCGAQTLLFKIRQRYWPIHGKATAKLITRQCMICFKHKPRNQIQQKMGNLPEVRITSQRIFSVVGLDYCGPFKTRNQSRRSKATFKSYVAVFICFTTKAVHLEVVSDLTTEAFIATLKRFVARRGRPIQINSDNATNFVGANNELRRLQELFILQKNYDRIKNFCSSEMIEWKFIPPRSPHFGGLWEAGVKSVKHHLRRITNNQVFSFEELNTLIVQIESILNSRPLSALSEDPNDLNPLTPGHFIIGTSMNSLPEPSFIDQNIKGLSRWRKVQHMTESFWKRWSVEYIQSLQQRNKWQRASMNVSIGALVLVKDETLPPNQWMLGRIVELHPGADNETRVVTLETKGGKIKRAVNKLCILPID